MAVFALRAIAFGLLPVFVFLLPVDLRRDTAFPAFNSEEVSPLWRNLDFFGTVRSLFGAYRLPREERLASGFSALSGAI